MLKITLRIAFTPVLVIMRIALCVTAFFTSIASSIIGLTTSIFTLLGVVEFAIGYWQNGIAFFVLVLLASPVGLPMIADFLLDRIDNVISFFEGLLA